MQLHFHNPTTKKSFLYNIKELDKDTLNKCINLILKDVGLVIKDNCYVINIGLQYNKPIIHIVDNGVTIFSNSSIFGYIESNEKLSESTLKLLEEVIATIEQYGFIVVSSTMYINSGKVRDNIFYIC